MPDNKADFFEVVCSQLGLHSTDYWTPYLSAWTRIGDYDAAAVFKSLNSGNQILRLNAFRGALHVIHIDNYPLILKATQSFHCKKIRDVPPLRPYSDTQIRDLLTKVMAALQEKPLRMRAIKKQVPEGGAAMRWIVLMAMCEGKIVRAFANHAKNTQVSYGLTERWFKDCKVPKIEEEDAVREIIREHIRLFGPVTLNDISWWLPATKTVVRSTIQEIGEEVESVSLDDVDYYINAEDYEIAASLELSSDPIVFFLPYEDHFAKAFIDRTWYISEETKKVLFPNSAKYYWPPECKAPAKIDPRMKQSGEKRPSIWVNGRIVGRWEFEGKDEKTSVVYRVLEKIPKKASTLIEETKIQLEEFTLERLVPISKKGAVKEPPHYPH